jgi:hypothetical protein
MKANDFCYWLQGFFEIYNASAEPTRSLSPQQVEVIQRHLHLVFKHDIDPQAGPPAYQNALNQIHNGGHRPNELMRC